MRRPSNDILTGKQPVPPAEASHMIECLEIKDNSLDILDSKVAYANLLCLGVDVRKEFTVGKGPVGTEFVKDLGERSRRHGDLAEMVQKGNLLSLVLLLMVLQDRKRRAVLPCCRWHHFHHGS